MRVLTRTCLLAVPALVASVLGASPAQALPADAVPLFPAEPSATGILDVPLVHTAAGLVYRSSTDRGIYVQPTGAETVEPTTFGWPDPPGDVLTAGYPSDTVSWRTIADPTAHTTPVPEGASYLAPTATGYVAARSSDSGDSYELVAVDLLHEGTTTVFGTSATSFTDSQLLVGPRGVALRPWPQDPDQEPGPFVYFPFEGQGPGQPTAPAKANDCALSSAALYCLVDTGAQQQLTRLPLTGGPGVTVDADVAMDPSRLVPMTDGVAFLSEDDATARYTLSIWKDAAAAPALRLGADFRLSGELARSTDPAQAVVVSRGGPVGQAGIWAVPADGGQPTQVRVADAAPRTALDLAVAPGQVMWADNATADGSVWRSDLTPSADGPTPGTPQRVTSSTVPGRTLLGVSGNRSTYTVESSSGRPQLVLSDAGTAQVVPGNADRANLSGDRLLVHAVDVASPTAAWSIRDLRTATPTVLPDALDYDLWGERLARLDRDGSVWVTDLRTGGDWTQVRVKSTASSVEGSVQIAGDVVAWSLTHEEPGPPEVRMRDVVTMEPAVPLDLYELHDLSTGYALGLGCDSGFCDEAWVALATGTMTQLEAGGAVIDGNTVVATDFDGRPAVFALPAYEDRPRLLASPGTAATLPAGGTWTARVVTSRVLTSCEVRISNAAGQVVRTLDCGSPHAAATVTWDGTDGAGAAVPFGTYTWLLAGGTDGAGLVDYDGTTTELSGTVRFGDTTVPAVVTTTPAANATAVAVTGTVTASFNEDVTGVTGATFTLERAADPVTAAVSYAPDTRVATLDPAASLAADTKYTATLTSGITDTAGNPLATRTWTFTTGPAPTATTTGPLTNATSVAVAGNVTATFNEAVTGLSGTTFVLKDPAGRAVTAAVGYNPTTRVATLNPAANLAADAKYTATLTSGITDTAGNPLATRSWTFTTGPAPTVKTTGPATNATAVAVAGNVTATFSEAVTGVSGTTFVLRDRAGKPVPAVVGYTNGVATLNPKANLAADTRYTATLTAGIRDRVGNPLATRSWTFTTGPAPTAVVGPAANTANVARGANVTARFSEPVTGVGTATVVLRSPTGATVPARVTYDKARRTVTLNPSATLAARTKYTVTLTGGTTAIRDAAGNPLATTRWSFTTGTR
ncbi:Ig-like domain-containing protein [Geodermatophilus sp. SYSU D00708]